MSSIPLHCNICPKKPKFSDVSHLLTHIASKGHLSHYYKIKVRSSTEEDCRIMIETYDQWYARYKVEDLMSERMNLKDKRRTRAVRNQAAITRSVPLARPRPVRRDTHVGHELDPRIGDPRGRADGRMTVSHLSHQHPSAQSLQHPMHPPSIQHQHQHPSHHLMQQHCHPPSHHPQQFLTPTGCIPGGSSMPYSRAYAPCMIPPNGMVHDLDGPFKRRRSELYDDRESEETFSSRSFSVPDGASLDQYDGAGEEPSESTKLKGVFWPGMDIFDSATPEMKRKRNQKKDTSVVAQLEANSLEVEPMEMIFTPLGTLKKARMISGNPEDDESSPIRGDTSPTRHYSNFTRPPLMPVPFDTSRLTSGSSSAYNSQYDVSRHLLRSLADQRSDVDFPYGPPKRKRNFEIFHDREISFSNPAGFGLLNSEFHLPGHSDSAQPSQSDTSRYEYKDHTPHHLYDPFHTHSSADGAHEKENVPIPAPMPTKSHQMDDHHHFSHGTHHPETYAPPVHPFSYPSAEQTLNTHDHYGSVYGHQTQSSAVFLPTYKSQDDHDDRTAHQSHVYDSVGTEVC